MASESTEKKEPKEIKVVTTIKTDVIEGEATGSEGAGDTKKKTTKKSTSKKSTTKNKGWGWGHTLAICGSILGGALIMCLCRHCKGGKGCSDCDGNDEPQRDTTEMVNNPQQKVDSALFWADIHIESEGDVGNVTIQQIYARDHGRAQGKVDNQSANHSDHFTQNQNSTPVSKPSTKKTVKKSMPLPDDHSNELPTLPKPKPEEPKPQNNTCTFTYTEEVLDIVRVRTR